MSYEVARMLTCDVCGGAAVTGSGVTVDGVRMGDVGSWRCEDHHPARQAHYTREQWAAARAAGLLYPAPVSHETAEAAE